jgi:hypothetical protein
MTPTSFDQLALPEKLRYTWSQGAYLLTSFSNVLFHTLYVVDGFFVEISSDAYTGSTVGVSAFRNCDGRIDEYIKTVDLTELVKQ